MKVANSFSINDLSDNKNFIIHNAMRFYDETLNIFSYSKTYFYNINNEINYNKIQPFLNHEKEMI